MKSIEKERQLREVAEQETKAAKQGTKAAKQRIEMLVGGSSGMPACTHSMVAPTSPPVSIKRFLLSLPPLQRPTPLWSWLMLFFTVVTVGLFIITLRDFLAKLSQVTFT